MAHPILHDTRRVLLSRTAILSMVLLIGVTFSLVSAFSGVSTTTQNQSPNAQVLSWYDNAGTYHFLVFETNAFGQPASGITLQANLSVSPFSIVSNSPITNPGSYPVYGGPSVTTNSSGEAGFTIKVPISDMSEVNANYTVPLIIHEPDGAIASAGAEPAPYSRSTTPENGISKYLPVSPGEVISITGNPIVVVTDPSNSQERELLVNWAGTDGSFPTGYSLYYVFINATQTCSAESGGCISTFSAPSNLSESNMTLLGSLTSYLQAFNLPTMEANLGNGSQLALGVFYSNGTVAISPQGKFYPISQLYPSFQGPSQQTTNKIVSFYMTSIYSLFIPLVAIICSYDLYGRDRVTGVLESVLVQPVSRAGLALSRFLSTFIGMAVAVLVSMGVVDGLVMYYAKSFLSTTFLLSAAGAFLVELAAFIGIMMLLSRIVKSSGLLIGIGLGLFLVFDFLWDELVPLAFTLAGTSSNSSGYIGYTIALEFVNPAQFIQLIFTYLTGQSSGVSISPAQYGISIPSLVITGILWVALPLAGFLYLAIKRD